MPAERTGLGFGLFISHASQDNDAAAALKARLQEHGYPDIFLDSDIDSGIRAGTNWIEALLDGLARSIVVLVLWSRHARASQWVFAELVVAQSRHKTIIPLLIDDAERDPLLAQLQWVDFRTLGAEAYRRIFAGLREAGARPDDTTVTTGRRSGTPYRGLAPLTEHDAAVFFGRTNEVIDAIEKLEGSRGGVGAQPGLLLVNGASGVGKSSFVRAGVAAKLRDRGWKVTRPIRPGSGWPRQLAEAVIRALEIPSEEWDVAFVERWLEDSAERSPAPALEHPGIHAAVETLARDARALLVVVDPLEEIVSQEPRSAIGFVHGLKALRQHATALTLATIRSDFIDPFGRVAGDWYVPLFLKPLARERQREVITRPADRFDVTVETRLVDTLLDQMETDDALPLLAYALQHLWENRTAANAMTLEDFRRLFPGGLDQAIADAADAVIAGKRHDAAAMAALRAAMLQMVRINEGGGYVPRAARWISIPLEARPLLDALVARRLCLRDQDRIDAAHDALFRRWRLAKEWIDQERGFIVWRVALAQPLNRWEGAGESDEELLVAGPLEEARRWVASHEPLLSATESAFVRRSLQKADRDAAEREAARRREIDQTRKIRASGIVITAGASLAEIHPERPCS
jgi:hypothetical protein